MAFKQTFSSLTDIGQYANNQLKSAEELTLAELYDVLMDIIDDYVYQGMMPHERKNMYSGGFGIWTRYSHNASYQQTGDFKYMWEVKNPYTRNRGEYIQTYGSVQINQGYRLTYDSAEAQHTSPEFARNPRNLTLEGLADIINNGLSEYHSMFGYIEPRPYWDDFMDYVQKNYNRIFAKYLQTLTTGIVRTTQQGTLIADFRTT